MMTLHIKWNPPPPVTIYNFQKICKYNMKKFVHNYKVIHLSGYEVRESKGAGEYLPRTGHRRPRGGVLV